MRKEKEIQDKLNELREKAFDMMERNMMKTPNKRISLRNIRLVINSLEYCLGKREDLEIIKDAYDNKLKMDGGI